MSYITGMEREKTEKLIGGVTGPELAKLIADCLAAFAKHVEQTGVDPLEKFYAAAKDSA